MHYANLVIEEDLKQLCLHCRITFRSIYSIYSIFHCIDIFLLFSKAIWNNQGELSINPFVHGRFSRPIIHGSSINHISLYTHSLPIFFLHKCSVLRVLGLKKASKFDLFEKNLNQIFIFENFAKILSEMISTHPFRPILIFWKIYF